MTIARHLLLMMWTVQLTISVNVNIHVDWLSGWWLRLRLLSLVVYSHNSCSCSRRCSRSCSGHHCSCGHTVRRRRWWRSVSVWSTMKTGFSVFGMSVFRFSHVADLCSILLPYGRRYDGNVSILWPSILRRLILTLPLGWLI